MKKLKPKEEVASSGEWGGSVEVEIPAEAGQGSCVLGSSPGYPIQSHSPGEETEANLGVEVLNLPCPSSLDLQNLRPGLQFAGFAARSNQRPFQVSPPPALVSLYPLTEPA